MPGPLTGVSGSQVQFQTQTQDVGGARGTFNGHEVTAGTGENRAGSALKTAWMEVKHFFKSLFGSKVSTDAPTEMNTVNDGAKGVISALSKSKVDDVAVLQTLATMIDKGNFPQDVNREGLTSGAKGVFHTELQSLSDMQLFRIYKNFQAKPELLEALTQLGTGIAMEDAETMMRNGATPQEMMRGAGKINDIGFAALALYGEIRDMLTARGYDAPDVDVGRRSNADPSREMEIVAKLTVERYGDMTTVFEDARTQIAQEKHAALIESLEISGIYERDRPQVQDHAPVQNQPSPAVVARDQALADPELDTITSVGLAHQDNVLAYFDRHFDVLSSDAFWSHNEAKINNFETFGSTLALVVMNRIAAQGEITRKDVEDLNKVYGHMNTSLGANLPAFDDTLVGPLGDGNGTPLTDRFKSVFLDRNAPAQLNVDAERQITMLTDYTQAPSIEDKFALVKTGHGLMWGGGQDIGILRQALTSPLNTIV